MDGCFFTDFYSPMNPQWISSPPSVKKKNHRFQTELRKLRCPVVINSAILTVARCQVGTTNGEVCILSKCGLYLELSPLPRMPVTTRIIVFLLGDPNQNPHLPRLHPGRGDNPSCILIALLLKTWLMLGKKWYKNMIPQPGSSL